MYVLYVIALNMRRKHFGALLHLSCIGELPTFVSPIPLTAEQREVKGMTVMSKEDSILDVHSKTRRSVVLRSVFFLVILIMLLCAYDEANVRSLIIYYIGEKI